MNQIRIVILLLFTLGFASTTRAEPALVAVAANFSYTAKALKSAFEKESNDTIKLSIGSTGKLYAQIINGAPYDIFLAADAARPAKLAQDNLIIGTPISYAKGRLALWGKSADIVEGKVDVILNNARHIALANPKLAPYGHAALETLKNLGLDQTLHAKLVWGESVSQAYQFVASGNATLGFVSYTQVKQSRMEKAYWIVPAHYHEPIDQHAVLLKRTQRDSAKQFFEFIQTAAAQSLIKSHGYDLADKD